MRPDLPTVLLGLTVIAAPVAVGGVHTITAMALLVPLVVAAIWLVNTDRGSDDDLEEGGEPAGFWVSILSIVFASLAGWCLFQLIPMPLGVHELVHGRAADLWAEGWRLGTGIEDVPWRPLSLDPEATADRGLRWLVLALGAVVGGNISSTRRWRASYVAILASGLVVLAVGAALRGTDPSTFFGFYEPSISFRGPSPFVSTNHAASFYAICGIVGLGGLALRRLNHPIEASVSGALGLLFLALAAVHNSDAVMASLGLSLVVLAGGILLRTDKGSRFRDRFRGHEGQIAYGMVAATCVLVLAWWFGALDGLTGLLVTPLEGSESALNRTMLVTGALEASKDHFVVGSGGGAVDVVVGRYIDWSTLRPASIPVVENDPVEWLLTYGWLMGGAAILALAVWAAYVGRRVLMRSRGVRWAVAGALVVFGAGVSLFHFPFLALGVSLPLVVCIDGMSAPRHPPTSRSFSRSGHVGLSRLSSIGLLATLVMMAVVLGAANWSWRVPDDASAEEKIRATPTDGRVYAALAADHIDDAPEQAQDLARLSARLDAAPDSRVFLARVLAATDADTEAAELYRDLLGSATEGGLVRMQWVVLDLERPEDRATALEKTTGARLQQGVRMVGRIEGPEAATDVVLALSDSRGDDPALHRAAIDTFLALGAVDLAQLWALSVEQRRVTDDGSLIGPGLLAKVALARGDRTEARAIAGEALEGERPSFDVAWVYLNDLPDVSKADKRIGEHVGRAMEIVCQSPLEPKRRKPCWLADAWQKEVSGEHQEATYVYQRIASRLDAPQYLARFWVRHGHCLELQRFLENLDNERQRKVVARIAKGCRS